MKTLKGIRVVFVDAGIPKARKMSSPLDPFVTL